MLETKFIGDNFEMLVMVLTIFVRLQHSKDFVRNSKICSKFYIVTNKKSPTSTCLQYLWSRWDSRGYKATLRYENHWLKSNSFTPINFCQLKAQINWCEWVWFWSMILMTLFDTNAISLNCVSTRWLKGDCQWKSDILILVLISFKHNWNQKILFRSLYVPLHRFPAGLDRFRCGHFHYGCFTVLVDLVISILKISKPLDEHFSGISEPRWSIDKPKSTNHN